MCDLFLVEHLPLSQATESKVGPSIIPSLQYYYLVAWHPMWCLRPFVTSAVYFTLFRYRHAVSIQSLLVEKSFLDMLC